MTVSKWIEANTTSLTGKTVAVSGATGGLGHALCGHIASLGASLILIDRNRTRSEALASDLSKKHKIKTKCVTADMADIVSVKAACELLNREPIDFLILNAGAYKIPRSITDAGFDNVFQINFLSPYYMTRTLLPLLQQRRGRVIAVGSIAHNYSQSDPEDIDFRTHTRPSKVYGNSKRYLMFALHELFKGEHRSSLSVVHPGISFTGITDHYPKVIFALIKHPMKVIFMKPQKACLSILRGIFEPCGYMEWIGPCLFDVWGYPKKSRLTSCSEEESRRIFETAERLYIKLCNGVKMAYSPVFLDEKSTR